MNRICRGCGEPFHAEENYERQCSECNQSNRDQAKERKELRIEILKARIFKRSMELQNKFNVVCYYYGYVDRLQVDVQPKEMKFEPPYMITTYVYCDGPNAEQELTLMLEELKSCLKL